MSWVNYQTKDQIKAVLRTMDPVAADAAKYLADLILENQEQLNVPESVGAMACSAIVRALRDADLPGGPSNTDVRMLVEEHGRMIGEVALTMAGNMRGFVKSLVEHEFFARCNFSNSRFTHDHIAA
jgi:hypothetical protein